MKKTGLLLALALVALLALSACQAPTATPAKTATATPAPTASPTPVPTETPTPTPAATEVSQIAGLPEDLPEYTGELATYTDPDGAYTFQYPSAYTVSAAEGYVTLTGTSATETVSIIPAAYTDDNNITEENAAAIIQQLEASAGTSGAIVTGAAAPYKDGLGIWFTVGSYSAIATVESKMFLFNNLPFSVTLMTMNMGGAVSTEAMQAMVVLIATFTPTA